MTTPTDLVLVPREQLVQLRDMAIDHKCQPIEECLFNVLMFCASAPSPWRDIESAPKDGTLILLYRPMATETGDEPIVIARGVSKPCKSPQGVIHYTDRCCHPTHWMPLPTPPKDSVQKRRER